MPRLRDPTLRQDLIRTAKEQAMLHGVPMECHGFSRLGLLELSRERRGYDHRSLVAENQTQS
jgi:hypothetical protein